ncbi:MAG: translation initiation factor IF-2 [Candidatus Omnitrophota bacterium]|jgi:translation initiation factor IF-2
MKPKTKESKTKKQKKSKALPKQRISKARTVKKKLSKAKPLKARKVGLRKKLGRVKKPAVAEPIKQEAVGAVEPQVKAVKPQTAIPSQVTTPAPEPSPVSQLNQIELDFPISVKDLSVKLQIKPSRLIQELMRMNILATINQPLSQEEATKICQVFGWQAKSAPDKDERLLWEHRQKDSPESLRLRSPVVTLMGHVDHGKTSLLDIIRKTNIVDGEHGGITQHIGAYEVVLPKGKITFLDTPGHEAFTAMRSRGAHITDIVVLVVAADDGVMPQTIEAIDHAKAANVPIVVAINKIDKPQVNIDRIKKQLSTLGLTPEDWQGKTIMVGVSAKTGEGVDELLEMILLEAEMLELKANYNKPASGLVIESRHDKNRGPLATLLVQNGTLHINDNLILGSVSAKVKAMFNDHAQRIEAAPPATPVEILGLAGMPAVGEEFFVIPDEKQARELIALRQEKERQRRVQPVKRISLEDLHSEIKQGKIKELKIIIKADVVGSLEAVRDCLEKLETPEIKFLIVHAGIGPINASDAMLASVTNAFILGFHVQPDERAKELIEKEAIETRTYNIIYELIQELKSALEGMLEPKIKKVFIGRAQIRKVFKLSRAGSVAGCWVVKGKIQRSCLVNLVRENQVIFEGKIANLKRFKDDVREIAEGFECGISLAGFDDYQEGDLIEAYEVQKIARKL